MKVLIAAGGSAGHVEPALTLADALTRRDKPAEVVFVGTAHGIEDSLVVPRGYPLRHVLAAALPRRVNRDLFATPVRLRAALRSVLAVIDDENVDVVVGFGGYVALPAYLAARRRGLPLVIHEANARAGLANKVGARLTRWQAQSVPGALPRAAVIGMPLRESIQRVAAMPPVERATAKEEARKALGLDPGCNTLLVFGGSLGARRINEAMAAMEPGLADRGIQVLHITGKQGAGLPEQWPPLRTEGQPAYVSVPYFASMQTAFSAADLVLCRAGAMTCAELAALGLPAIYVPLPIGNGEQELNARPVTEAGGGIVVLDADVFSATVSETIGTFFASPDRLAQMSAAAQGLGVTNADEQLADMVNAAAAMGGRE